MSYKALYRKLRPKNFDEVIGQEHIITTLENQIQGDKVTHSYLFCGTRGTGKTSTAKIFANILNCKDRKGFEPCGKCSVCVAFKENNSLNIIEIDAASNNGVDDIREIKEEIKYKPADAKYKIYIIDEVHMLSIGAFNALLKTLEEPPSHIIFILATTDVHKIPITILSRCQRFDFKRICVKDMVSSLKISMEIENINITEDALYYVAKVADGAMRDALSIIDQCIALYYNEEITLEKMLDALGSVDDKIFFEFVDLLIDFNTIKTLDMIDKIVEDGKDITQFTTDLIGHIRNLLIASITLSCENNVGIPLEKFMDYKSQVVKIDSNYLVKMIEIFSLLLTSLKYTFNEKIALETTCIKICCAIKEEDIFDMKEKIRLLEKKLEEKELEEKEKEVIYVQESNPKYIDENEREIERLEKEREKAIPEELKSIIENYNMLIKNLPVPVNDFVKFTKVKAIDDVLCIICEKVMFPSIEKNLDIIKETLYSVFKKECKVKIMVKNQYEHTLKNNGSIEDIKNILPESILEYKEI